MNKVLLPLALVLTGVAGSAAAQGAWMPAEPSNFLVCKTTETPATVAFANGLLSTWASANEALEGTVAQLGQKELPVADRGTLLFHTDKVMLDELRTLFEQRLSEAQLPVDEREAAYASFFGFLSASENEPLAGSQWWEETHAALSAAVLARMTAVSTQAAQDPARIEFEAGPDAAAIRALVEAGKGVLVAAHGHGSLYANSALAQAVDPASPQRVRLVGAAPAASTQWSGGPQGAPYVTSQSDQVLNALDHALYLTAQPRPLPGNFVDTSRPVSVGFTGHGFLANYLNVDATVGQAFVKQLVLAFREVADAAASPAELAFKLTASTYLDPAAASGFTQGVWGVTPAREIPMADGTPMASFVETFDPLTGVLTTTTTLYCGYLASFPPGTTPTPASFMVPSGYARPSQVEIRLQPGSGEEPAVHVLYWPFPKYDGPPKAIYDIGTMEMTPSAEGVKLLWMPLSNLL